ncbi:MAG TPA: haloalkane dehalogenase [Acidimicrobiales bacterium]|nr:MAG: haloalkane dehalogenase [Actinobacteria bacterium 21-64-8]HQT99837.1 haloalkane dehalogenase [Acidimicrobiales bacterium]
MQRLRTPDERFENLPDFPFLAHYVEVTDPTGGEALRMAYLDEGPREADVVVVLHGEPTWSFLYRHVLRLLVAEGHRVVAPDLIGFGRSDKPASREDYTYARHVEWTRELLFTHLELRDVTLFGQDWGSLIGLRLVAEHPERFARVAIGNGGLPTGAEGTTEAFLNWQAYSQNAPELPIGRIVSGGCVRKPLDDAVIAAYDAPFPDEGFKEGARQFPMLVPTTPEDPAHDDNVAAWRVLEGFTKPFLMCFSDGDAITKGGERRFLSHVPGTKGQAHTTIVGGGHFLQEDEGPQLAAVLHRFITSI